MHTSYWIVLPDKIEGFGEGALTKDCLTEESLPVLAGFIQQTSHEIDEGNSYLWANIPQDVLDIIKTEYAEVTDEELDEEDFYYGLFIIGGRWNGGLGTGTFIETDKDIYQEQVEGNIAKCSDVAQRLENDEASGSQTEFLPKYLVVVDSSWDYVEDRYSNVNLDDFHDPANRKVFIDALKKYADRYVLSADFKS